MSLSIEPTTTVEEVVYQRLISYIPAGQFYLRAKHVQPRRNGTTIVPFRISGQRGDPSSDGSRVMVDIYINESFVTRLGMTANVTSVDLELQPPPFINYIRCVEGNYDPTIDLFTPTGDSTGTSVVVTNYGSVLYGAALDYFRHVWLPYQIQDWSLTSEWGSRLVEWYFKYHKQMPDTQAIRTLATRLTSRATWHELPTTRGVEDMVASLCCSEPVILPLTNERDFFDLAIWPTVPVSSNHGGWEFNTWFPDVPTAREVAVLQLVKNLPDLLLKDHREGTTLLETSGIGIELFKDTTQSNLSWILEHLDIMPWKAFLEVSKIRDVFRRFWDNAFDNLVTPPGLGAGDFFDTDIRFWPDHTDEFDAPQDLDSSQEEPYTELWTGMGVNPADRVEIWDSVIQTAVAENQIDPRAPVSWEWEWTGVLEMEAATSSSVTNTLHGGADPEFEDTGSGVGGGGGEYLPP
jgi:hypothetical protein